MASSGNTWCKKLMARGKRHAMGKKLGTFKPLSVASTLDKQPEVKKVRNYLSVVRADYVAPRKRRAGNGSRLSSEIRAKLAERNTLRAAFFDGLKA